MTIQSASNFQAAQTLSQVQMKVARKSLDAQKQQGDAAVQLIQAAGSIGKQGGGDQLAAAATGLGGKLDVRA